MVFDALDETVVRSLTAAVGVRVRTAVSFVVPHVHVQVADGVDERVHLDLHLSDEQHHGEHHARDAGQHAQRDDELGGVHGDVPGDRQPRPRRPHAEYERGRRVDVTVAGHPYDRCHAHHHVGGGHDGAVRAHEPREQRVRGLLAPVVPEVAPHRVQHPAQPGPLVHADGEQGQRARRARDVREHLDRFLVAGVSHRQRRGHRRHDERPERAYQPRVRGRDPLDCNLKNHDRFTAYIIY